MLAMGSALAAVEIPDGQNVINFTAPNGSISFGGGGSIIGLSDLTVAGSFSANQIAVGTLANLSASSMQAVTGSQLYQTNLNVTNAQNAAATANAAIGALETRVENASQGWSLAATGTAGQENIAPGESVTFTAGKNLVVDRTGSAITYRTADEVAFTNVAATNGLTVGDVLGSQTIVTSSGLITNTLNVGAGRLEVNGGGLRVGAGTTVDMGGNKITNVADGAINLTSTELVNGRQVHDLFFEQGAGGVRYFHTNSADIDSRAIGDQSIAVGPKALSQGFNSFAAGSNATTSLTASGALAIGQDATAGTEGGAVPDGENSIAIGRASLASGNSTTAIGNGARVEDARALNAIALGTAARVSGLQSGQAIAIGSQAHASTVGATAIGSEAQASGENAAAFGAGANAAGNQSIALGNANASAGRSLAAGAGAYVGTADSVALGTLAGVGTEGNDAGDRTSHVAIGTRAGQNVAGNQDTSIGYGAGSRVTGDDNIALGTQSGTGITGNNNIAVGVGANADAGARAQSIAIGGRSSAGSDSVALGDGAKANGNETLALGKDAEADENGVALGAHAIARGNSIAIGRNSAALTTDSFGTAYLTGAAAPGSVVSVGNTGTGLQRRIVNVADGANGHDAVNINQLRASQQSVANLVGGSVTLDAAGTYGGHVIELTDTGGTSHQYTTVAAAINAVSSGAISVLPGNAVIYNPNGTITVAAGDLGTDAVNINQLNAAIAQSGVKYFSANTTIDPNDANDGATGTNAMAIGPAAVAGGDSSLAIGHTATVNNGASEALAVGHNVSARAQNSTTLGNNSHTYDQGGIAVGQQAVSRGQNSIVMGTGAEADPKSDGTVDNAIVIGTLAEATADNGIAVGESALASELRAVAQGFDAHATADDALALGTRSRASGVNSKAFGTDAAASGINAQANGTRALATGANSIASGTDSYSYASNGVAVGSGARSGVANAAPEEASRNANSVAIGQNALADYGNALALGVESKASGQSASAIGDGAQAIATDSLALGSGARASAEGASALGDGSQALHAGSVALGRNAITAAPVGTASANIDKVTYNYAGSAPVATVSVGDAGQERTITHVAAGRVALTSTDAINGSQLFQTNAAVNALGNNLDTAGTSVATALGGTSTFNPITHTVTAGLSVRGNNYNNVQDAMSYLGQGWNVSAEGGTGANVAPGGAVDFSNSDGNIQVNRVGTNLVFDLSDQVSASSLTTGDTVISNTGVQVGSDVRLGSTGLLITNGPSITQSGINGGNLRLSNLAPGSIGTDAVNVNQLNALGATPLTFAGDTGTNVERQLGETLNVLGGAGSSPLSEGNIGVVANGSDALAIKLAQNVDLGSSGSISIGNARVNNGGFSVSDLGGNVTTVGAGIVTVAANPVDGLANSVAINASTGRITGLTNKAFDPNQFTSGQAATEDQLKSVAEIAGAGWTVTDAAGSRAKIAGNGEVKFEGGANLTVAQTGQDDAGVVEISLKEAVDLGPSGSLAIGDTRLDNVGLTVADGAGSLTRTTAAGTTVSSTSGATTIGAGMVTIAGISKSITLNGGDGTITGLTNKTFNPNLITSGRAATEDQLKSVSDIANAGWTVTDGAGNSAKIAPNGQVRFEGDSNLAVVQKGVDDAGVIGISLNNAVDLGIDGSLAIGGTVINGVGISLLDGAGNSTRTTAAGTTVSGAAGTTSVGAGIVTVAGGTNSIAVNGNTGTVGGLSNKTFDPTQFVSGQAATEDQLRTVSDVANAGWNVSVGGEGAKADGRVRPGGKVDFSNTDGNIKISRDETNLAFDLADDLVVANSIAVGNTQMSSDGIRLRNNAGDELVALTNAGLLIANGPSVTINGINASGTKITNVAAGTDTTDAVNVGQLKDVQQNVDNLGDRAVKYDGSVGDPKSTITLEGANGTAITNLADGRIESGSKDAVNGGQIHDMGQSVAAGIGGNSKLVDGKLVTDLAVAGKSYSSVNDALGGVHEDLSSQIGNVENLANAGWTVTDSSNNANKIGPNGQVAFIGDNNISIQQTGAANQGRVEVKLNENITAKSITTVQLDAQTITTNEVVINNGGPIINETGIDMSGKRIGNLAEGIEPGDAVNVGQLGRVAGELQGQVNSLRGDLHRQDRKLSAGVAAAMATASLPQAYLPGKTMMGMAGGTWNGESGMAIGFSGISDNGKWVYKVSGNSTSRGDYGGAVGVGYQW
jgi:autotransporter adhesin